MRILFDDPEGRRIALEASCVAAIPDADSDEWYVVADEYGGRSLIVAEHRSEREAKEIVRKVSGMTYVVHDVQDVQDSF